jgi:O-antigen/teichoic acid export membrane protein
LVAAPLAGLALLALVFVIPVDGLPRFEIALTLLVVLPMVPLYLALGQLQAEERFVPFSFATACIGLPRPFFLLVLAAAGAGVFAALGASAAAMLVAATIAVIAASARRPPPDAPDSAALRSFTASLPPLLVGLGGMALLTNLDIVVAKLALPAQQAGEFGAIAALGKAIVVVPQTVSVIVLPRVAARRAEGRDTGPLLAAAVGITLALGGIATLVAATLHDPIVRYTYGPEFVGAAELLAPLVAASTLLGALIVLLNHHIGRSADAFVWGLVAVAAFQAVLFMFFNSSPGQIIAVDAVACAAGLIVHDLIMGRGPDGIAVGLVRLMKSRRRRASSAP